MDKFLKVAAYQGHAIVQDPTRALKKILEVMTEADNNNVDILCMPESYLHGYLKSDKEVTEHSISLDSLEFQVFCHEFRSFRTTLLLGLNERYQNKFYNTVVVIENGLCIGFYRKAYTYAPYDYFSLGSDFPIFKKKGVPYGVVICYDINFLEPSRILALKGAKVIFCPMWNSISKDAKMLAWMHNKSHFMARALENRCWIVASDIIVDEDKNETCSGYSCIISNKGELVSKSEPFAENLLTYSIPISSLKNDSERYLKGRKDLFEKMIDTYKEKYGCHDLTS